MGLAGKSPQISNFLLPLPSLALPRLRPSTRTVRTTTVQLYWPTEYSCNESLQILSSSRDPRTVVQWRFGTHGTTHSLSRQRKARVFYSCTA
jgi:hypothetical protein